MEHIITILQCNMSRQNGHISRDDENDEMKSSLLLIMIADC